MEVPKTFRQDFIKNIKKKYKNIKFTYLFSPPFRKLSLKEKKIFKKKLINQKLIYYL